MSVFTIRVSIEHDGQQVSGFPMTRRLEDSLQEAKIIDQQWPDNDVQEPVSLGSTTSPISALFFEKAATVEFGIYVGLSTFSLEAGGIAIVMGNAGMGYAPTAYSRVRGVA